ncbi:hypothetical protein [Marinobacterium aestuariivivens]|uniref:Uncharacterized protein n=1 Tax=Marinobacterium aestuariivivens TaxID=1698799 RepID=A0ABW2A370_9GAMM
MNTHTLINKLHAIESGIEWAELKTLPDNAKLNIGSTGPLPAAELFNSRNSANTGVFSPVVYYAPGSKSGVLMLLNGREMAIVAALRDGNWVMINDLKHDHLETRKPVSNLRQMGVIIATACNEHCHEWLMLGKIDLYPTAELIANAAPLPNVLPCREVAEKVEVERAQAAFARRLANIKRRTSHLRSGDPEQMQLPTTTA